MCRIYECISFILLSLCEGRFQINQTSLHSHRSYDSMVVYMYLYFYWFLCLMLSTVPTPPSVTIEASGTSIAGETYSLTCSVSLEQVLRQSPVIEWIGPDGRAVQNGALV